MGEQAGQTVHRFFFFLFPDFKQSLYEVGGPPFPL